MKALNSKVTLLLIVLLFGTIATATSQSRSKALAVDFNESKNETTTQRGDGDDFIISIDVPNTSDGLDQFTNCGFPRTINVQLTNTSGDTIINLNTDIDFPASFEFYGNVSGGVITDSTNAQIQLTDTILNGEAISFSFDVQATCVASSGDKIGFIYDYSILESATLTQLDTMCVDSTDEISVLSPTLAILNQTLEGNFSTGSTPLFDIYLGMIDTTKFGIVNSGNGGYDQLFAYVDAHPNMNLLALQVCGTSDTILAIDTVAGPFGDRYVYLLDSTIFQNSIGGVSPVDPNKLERNELIELCALWEVTLCPIATNVSDVTFGALSSCTNEFSNACEQVDRALGVVSGRQRPVIQAGLHLDTLGEPYPTCRDANTPSHFGYFFVNNGTAASGGFDVNINMLDGNTTRSYFYQPSFQYYINGDTIRTPIPAADITRVNRFSNGNRPEQQSCGFAGNFLLEDRQINVAFNNITLEIGDTLFLTFEMYGTDCGCGDNCIVDSRWSHEIRRVRAVGVCGTTLLQNQSTISAASGEYRAWPRMRVETSSSLQAEQTNICDGGINTFSHNMNNIINSYLNNSGIDYDDQRNQVYFSAGNACTDCSLEFQYILGDGFDYINGSLSWVTNDSITWTPDFISYTDNGDGFSDTITVRFDAPVVGLERFFFGNDSKLEFQYQADCNEVPTIPCGTLLEPSSITRQSNFIFDKNCTTGCSKETIECEETIILDIQTEASGGTQCSCVGFNNNFLDAVRVNRYISDPDNDGSPDPDSSYNESIIENKRYLKGDIIEVQMAGFVSDSNGTGSYDSLFSVIELDHNNYVPEGGIIEVYRGGALQFSCDVLSQFIVGTSLYTNLSITSLTANTCAVIPPGFRYMDGDSVYAGIKYTDNDTLANPNTDALEDKIIQARIYLSFGNTPFDNEELCSPAYQYRLTQIGVQFNEDHFTDQRGLDGCQQIRQRFRTGARIGNGGTVDYFPGEYIGDFEHMDQIAFTLSPAGLTPTSLYVRVQGATNSSAGNPHFGGTNITGVPTRTITLPHPSVSIIDNENIVFNPDIYFNEEFGLSGQPQYDQGIRYELRAFYIPACNAVVGQSYDFSVDAQFTTDPKLYNSNSREFSETDTYTDVINSVASLNVNVIPKNQVYKNSPTCVIAQVEGTGAAAENVWIGIENNSGFVTINSVRVVSTNTYLADNGFGLYQIGSIPLGDIITMELCLNINSCSTEEVRILSGFDCLEYPNVIQQATCTFEDTLTLTPLNASFTAQLLEPSSDPYIINLCDTVEFVIDITNTNDAYMYNLENYFRLPSGMQIVPGSEEISYPIANGFTPVPNPANNLFDNFYRINLSESNPVLDTVGLIGTDGVLTNENITQYRFKAFVGCGFRARSRAQFFVRGENSCGIRLPFQRLTSSSLRIASAADPYASSITGSSEVLNACQGEQTDVQISFIIAGSASTTSGDSLKISLPFGINYVPNSLNTLAGIDIGEPDAFVDNNGEEQLVWGIEGINPSQGSDFTITIEAKDVNQDCGEALINVATVNTQQGLCNATVPATICDFDVVSSEFDIPITIVKPNNITINSTVLAIPQAPSSELVVITTEICNNGDVDIFPGDTVSINIYDDNGDGRFINGEDLLLETIQYTEGVLFGGCITTIDTVVLPAGSTCDVLSVLDTSNNCLCSIVQSPLIEGDLNVVFAEDTTTCSDQLITFGPENNTGYGYIWFPIAGPDTGQLSDALVTPTSLQLENLTGNNLTAQFGLITDRGNCSVVDTMSITIFPNQDDSIGVEVCTPVAGCGTVSDGTFNLTGPLGGSNYSWSILSGDLTAVIDDNSNPLSEVTAGISATTVFQLNYTDNNGCDATFLQTAIPINCACTGIGDFVWIDLSNDGIQDVSEPALEGVEVYLYDATNLTSPIGATVTDSNGFYFFSPLSAGNYVVGFDVTNALTSAIPSAGLNTTFMVSPQNIGNDSLDSDIDSLGFSMASFVSAGTLDSTIDAGFVPLGAIGDFIFLDANSNGSEDGGETGISGITVYLINNLGDTIGTTITDGNGMYLFDGLLSAMYTILLDVSTIPSSVVQSYDSDGIVSPLSSTLTLMIGEDNTTQSFGFAPLGSIGNYIWLDKNINGAQDRDEVGIVGATVYLLNGLTGDTVDTQITDSTGQYSFDDIGLGQYSVLVDPTTAPLPFVINSTTQNVDTTRNLDSDIDSTTLQTVVFTFDPQNGDSLDIDAGFWTPANIGDFVWRDNDYDGIQDGNEVGIGGVLVSLIDRNSGVTIQTSTTYANGAYLFTNVPKGAFNIAFDVSGNTEGTAFGFTYQNTAPTNLLDSDVDPLYAAIRNVMFDPCNGDSLDLDAGLAPPPASIGDIVWLDEDNSRTVNNGETGINGVTIYLLDSLGVVIDSTITNSNGAYLFDSLAFGSYTVQLDTSTLPNGLVQTYDNDGTNTANQSRLTLTTGESNLNQDFGYRCNLFAAGLSNLACNPGIIFSDGSDDFITFDLNPIRLNYSATYTITVNNGGSFIGGSTGSFNTLTSFRMQNGSANGVTIYTVTITDNNDGCSITFVVFSEPCIFCEPSIGTIRNIRNE